MNIFPYSNFHELNLDWIIDELKKTNENLVEFVKLNTIKYADPLQWDITDSYETNTVVIDEKTGYAYLSSQPVPPGVDIEREDYWVPVFNVYTIYEQIKDGVAYNNRSVDTSLYDIPNGGLVWVDQKLYKATKDIGKGDRFTSSNTVETTVDKELRGLLSEIGTVRSEIKDYDPEIAKLQSEINNTNKTVEVISDKTEKNTEDIVKLRSEIADINVEGWVTPQQFGAKGDGVTDDTLAFKNAVEYCIVNNKGLYIPVVGGKLDDDGYILSAPINIDYPISIYAEPTAVLNWKNAHINTDPTTSVGRNGATLYNSGYGINIDYGNLGGHKGYYRFPILQGDKSYTYPGGTSPSGHYWTGVRIANGDLIDFTATYISYWAIGIEVTSTNSWTDNCSINFQVMDDCETGILIDPAINYPVADLSINFNTIGLSKYSISISGDGSFRNSTINGLQLFVEYKDGLCIGHWGSGDVTNCQFTINNCNNHNSPFTPLKTGKNDTWVGDIIKGSDNVFKANNCTFHLGVDDYHKNATGVIAFTGVGNTFVNSQVGLEGGYNSPVMLSKIGNRSDFNGGKMLLANKNYVGFITDSDIAEGSELSVYAYSYIIPTNNDSPIMIVPCSNNGDVYAYATNDHEAEPNRIKITIHAVKTLPSNWYTRWCLYV